MNNETNYIQTSQYATGVETSSFQRQTNNIRNIIGKHNSIM